MKLVREDIKLVINTGALENVSIAFTFGLFLMTNDNDKSVPRYKSSLAELAAISRYGLG